jgi:hypothetical protein
MKYIAGVPKGHQGHWQTQLQSTYFQGTPEAINQAAAPSMDSQVVILTALLF